MENNQKAFYWLLISGAVVAAFVVALGLYLLLVRQPQHTPSLQQKDPQTTTSTTTVDVYVGWKTYSNALYNYQFKYPPTYEIDGQSTPEMLVVRAGDQKVALVVSVDDTVETVGEQVQKTIKIYQTNAQDAVASVTVTHKPYTIGEYSGYLVQSKSADLLESTDEIFLVQKGKDIFSFIYSYQQQYTNKQSLMLVQQMLASLSFRE